MPAGDRLARAGPIVKAFKVATYINERPGKPPRFEAYTRIYSPDWPTYRLHTVQAESGKEAKRIAIEERRQQEGHGETDCRKNDDNIHCVHWYDGDKCCACGNGPSNLVCHKCGEGYDTQAEALNCVVCATAVAALPAPARGGGE